MSSALPAVRQGSLAVLAMSYGAKLIGLRSAGWLPHSAPVRVGVPAEPRSVARTRGRARRTLAAEPPLKE